MLALVGAKPIAAIGVGKIAVVASIISYTALVTDVTDVTNTGQTPTGLCTVPFTSFFHCQYHPFHTHLTWQTRRLVHRINQFKLNSFY